MAMLNNQMLVPSLFYDIVISDAWKWKIAISEPADEVTKESVLTSKDTRF